MQSKRAKKTRVHPVALAIVKLQNKALAAGLYRTNRALQEAGRAFGMDVDPMLHSVNGEWRRNRESFKPCLTRTGKPRRMCKSWPHCDCIARGRESACSEGRNHV